MKKLTAVFLLSCITAVASAQLRADLSYKFLSSVNRHKLLTAGNSATGDADIVCLSESNNNTSWKAIAAPGGYYKIKNSGNNKFLAVSGGSRDAGAMIITWTDEGQQDILWKVIQSGDARTGFTYKLRNKSSNLYLAIEGGRIETGAPALQWADEGQADIVWRIEGKPELVVVDEATPRNDGFTIDAAGNLIMRKSYWQPMFTRAFSGFRIDINNYTPTAFEATTDNTYKYQRPNDNFFRFGTEEYRFPIMPLRMDPATIYFINLKSTAPVIATTGANMRIEVNYQAPATHEVLANCINNISCGGGMWWIHLYGFKLSLYITPSIEGGKFSYSTVNVRGSGRVRSDGMNVVVQNFNNGALFTQLANKIESQLRREEVKQFIADNLNRALASAMRTATASASGAGDTQFFTIFSRVSIMSNGDLKFER